MKAVATVGRQVERKPPLAAMRNALVHMDTLVTPEHVDQFVRSTHFLMETKENCNFSIVSEWRLLHHERHCWWLRRTPIVLRVAKRLPNTFNPVLRWKQLVWTVLTLKLIGHGRARSVWCLPSVKLVRQSHETVGHAMLATLQSRRLNGALAEQRKNVAVVSNTHRKCGKMTRALS